MYMNPQSKQKRIAFGYMRLANNQIAIHEGQAAALKLIYAMYCCKKLLLQISSPAAKLQTKESMRNT